MNLNLNLSFSGSIFSYGKFLATSIINRIYGLHLRSLSTKLRSFHIFRLNAAACKSSEIALASLWPLLTAIMRCVFYLIYEHLTSFTMRLEKQIK